MLASGGTVSRRALYRASSLLLRRARSPSDRPRVWHRGRLAQHEQGAMRDRVAAALFLRSSSSGSGRTPPCNETPRPFVAPRHQPPESDGRRRNREGALRHPRSSTCPCAPRQAGRPPRLSQIRVGLAEEGHDQATSGLLDDRFELVRHLLLEAAAICCTAATSPRSTSVRSPS